MWPLESLFVSFQNRFSNELAKESSLKQCSNNWERWRDARSLAKAHDDIAIAIAAACVCLSKSQTVWITIN